MADYYTFERSISPFLRHRRRFSFETRLREQLINSSRRGDQTEDVKRTQKYETRGGRRIRTKRTGRERRGPARRARGSRARKVPRVRAQGDEKNERSLFPVPRQFYEYEIRGRSVGRTAAVHAARSAQSSQTRPPYWLCIRPPASSVSLLSSR